MYMDGLALDFGNSIADTLELQPLISEPSMLISTTYALELHLFCI